MIIVRYIDALRNSRFYELVQNLIILVLIMSVFVYPTYFGPTRLENYFLPFLILVLATKRASFDHTIIVILILNLIIGLISVVYNLNFYFGLMESMRWIKYMLVFIFFSSMTKSEREVARRCIYIAFYIMVVVNVIQVINPMNLGVELARIYSQHSLFSSEREVLDRSFRLLGTAINPNNNALLWLLISIYFLMEYYEERKYLSLFYFFLCFLFIIFTQSRTAIVTLIIIGLLNLSLYRLSWRHLIYLIVLAIAGMAVAVIFQFTYLWQLFLTNPLEIHSLQLRFSIWTDLLELFYQKPFFGWGNLQNYESLYPKPPDNEFLYVLLNNGAIGLFGILVLFIYVVFYFLRNRQKYRYSYLPIFTIVFCIIIGVTNLAISNIRVGIYLFAVWGMAYSYRNTT